MNRRILRKVLPPAVLTAALAFPCSAAAESPADQAQRLFDEAIVLMKSDKTAEACPRLEESQRLDPGMATEFRLAECYEKLGRTATAHALFLKVASEAQAEKNHDREDVARRRAGALSIVLVKLILSVAPAVRGIDGITITLDAAPLDRASWGTAIPIDPGEHLLEASAPGRERWRTTFRAFPKPGILFREVPPLALSTDTGFGDSKSAWSTQRKISLALGGVGVIGVILGTGFGITTFVKTGAASCSSADPPVCDAEGVRLHHDANSTATVSNVAFAVGGAALIGGAALFLTAPRDRWRSAGAPRLSIGVRTTGLMLHGEW